jgi:hypothetical protein
MTCGFPGAIWSDGVFVSACIWFDIPARKMRFYVPVDIGERLLAYAERPE